eukprot:TRINITY_DN6327_c0_g1_i1.p2 TRINITY_DN6327_c0_g1~~TRINITY_DN6327_c0_g1_i1.p2  ORF type:complete len:137 (+),score=25.58 TRINITY_DN6327_c0_g1_i1:55-465(+)
MTNEAAGKQEITELKEKKEGILERQRERKQSQSEAHAAGLPPGQGKSVSESPATSPKGSPLDSPGIDALVAVNPDKLPGILLLNNCVESAKFNSSGGSAASGAGRSAALHILQEAMTTGDETAQSPGLTPLIAAAE